MTTARARAVPFAVGKTFRSILLTAGSCIAISALPSTAIAACTADGNANSCVLVITPPAPAAGQADIAVDSVDALGGTDTLVFNTAGLTLNASAIGTTLGSGVRFANFEEAQVAAGGSLTLTGATGGATSSLLWTIDAGGSLFARGGSAISDTSVVIVNGLLEVGGGAGPTFFDETIGSLAGSGSVSILNAKTLTAGGNGADTTFSGVISGNGGFTKSGTGTLTLTGNNSYSGTTTVNGGILEIGVGGDIAQSTAVTIGINSQLTGRTAYTINGPVNNSGRLAGQVTVFGNVSNSGGLLPGNTSIPTGASVPNPGQDMGTITIHGDYTAAAQGAFVGMFVDLDAALPAGTPGTTHDYLDIQGNVTGAIPSYLYLAEFDAGADTGIATTGNGIQLINITGTNTADAFRQGSALVAGPYQYLLKYVADYSGVPGTADGYFLQSAVRDEMIAHPALLSAGQALVRHCFRDDQRIPDSPKGATYGRAWVGYHQGNASFGADTGIDMDQDYNCTTGGMDWRMGYGWFGGVSGGFGKSNADIVTPSGGGNLDGSARAIEAYASFTSSSLFVNLSAGYTDMDWTYKNVLATSETASTSGFIGSAQAGVALDVEPFAVKLLGTVSYDGTDCGEQCFGFAVTEDTGLIEARGTVRIDGVTWGGSVRPWAQVSYSDVLSDGINTVSLGAVSVSADTNSELLIFDAGLQAYLDENLALFADGGYHESLSKDITGYKGGIGLKLYW